MNGRDNTAADVKLPPASEEYLDMITGRRSVYGLNKDLPITEERLTKVVKAALHTAPSAFGVETTRVCILFGEHHDTVWELTKEALRRVSSPESAAQGSQKIDACFKAGAGTVLFFEDERAVAAARKELGGHVHAHNVDDDEAATEERFHHISQANNAMAQFTVWSVLSKAGIGASLQHYQNIVREPLGKAFKLPPWWRLQAMMPVGGIAAQPDAKEFAPIEQRFIVKDSDAMTARGRAGEEHREY